MSGADTISSGKKFKDRIQQLSELRRGLVHHTDAQYGTADDPVFVMHIEIDGQVSTVFRFWNLDCLVMCIVQWKCVVLAKMCRVLAKNHPKYCHIATISSYFILFMYLMSCRTKSGNTALSAHVYTRQESPLLLTDPAQRMLNILYRIIWYSVVTVSKISPSVGFGRFCKKNRGFRFGFGFCLSRFPPVVNVVRLCDPLHIKPAAVRYIFLCITPVDSSKYPTAWDWWRTNHHLYPTSHVLRNATCLAVCATDICC